MKYLVLVSLWVAFCFLHSAMINPVLTNFLKRRIGDNFRFYRLFYNIFSGLLLVPAVLYSYSIMEPPFFIWQGYLLPIKYLLLIAGFWLFYAGSRHYSMSTFLGISQIREGVTHSLINNSGTIEKGGVLGVIRHPFYTGSLLVIWTGNLDMTRLIINVILSLYLVIGTMLEEKKLITEFGDVYRNYQQDVSMLFPWKYIKRKLKFL
ncbi:MAG: NnrU family protein [Bacteroidota bacterium]